MFNNFELDIGSILKIAEEERIELRHPYVGTEHLLLAILSSDKDIMKLFKSYGLTYDLFKKELIMIVGSASKVQNISLYTPMLKRVIENAKSYAEEFNNGKVLTKYLATSLLEEGEGIAIRLLIGLNIDIDSIYDELKENNSTNNKKLTLYDIGLNLNERVDLEEVVIGRDEEINLIIETLLRKKKNNPILVGDAGVGKTAIVEELARRIEKGQVPKELLNYKVVSLEMGSLVSGTKYRGEFEEKLTKIIKELEENKNIILFIDEIHTMISAGGAEGAISAGDIFKPALSRGNIKCIGATTKEEYDRYFRKDKALMRRFELINILEPNKEETKDILSKVKKEYEHHHNVIINNNIIDLIIELTDKFISTKNNPDKAIDFLDSVCSYVRINTTTNNKELELESKLDKLKKDKDIAIKNNDYEKALNIYKEEININKKINNNDYKKIIVKEKDIISVLENKTNIPLSKTNIKKLDNIKKKEKDNNLKEIIDYIEYSFNNRVSTIKFYLENDNSIVNVLKDSIKKVEYINIDLNNISSNKLLGSNKGYVGYEEGHLLNKVKNDTLNIILFQNYHLASLEIKEIIKKILKDNYIIDNSGYKISFNNTIIFISSKNESNIVGFNNNDSKVNELSDLVDKSIIYKKECLNN